VATGIGFLGAGAILRGDGKVHGLTTAAGIWVTAGIGVAAGLGQVVLAVGSTVLAVVVIAVLSVTRLADRGIQHADDTEN
jgi:putative Mg2+ transporter-C (MgtC) family protein